MDGKWNIHCISGYEFINSPEQLIHRPDLCLLRESRKGNPQGIQPSLLQDQGTQMSITELSLALLWLWQAILQA